MRYLWLLGIFLLSACSDSPGTTPTPCSPGSSGEDCAACEVGFYCDGENAPAACEDGTWDDDADPATPCVSWRTCEAGNGILGGSSTTDATCTPCASGTFSDGTGACSAWTECAPGQRVAGEGSASADVACSACESGTFSTTSDATTCEAWTACAPGTFVQTPGSATTDQLCASCASGTFSSVQDATACESWTVCQPGAFVATAGNTFADQTCETCAEGTYSQMPDSAQCMPVGECAAGTVQTTPATGTTPVACETCAPGTFCAGGEADPVACPDGTWDHDQNPASPCEAWTQCEAGEYVRATGSTTEDRTCDSCATGTFSTTQNAATCGAWTTCEAGEFVLAAGSKTQDRTCDSCATDTFSTTQNAATCGAWTTCEAGEFVSASGSTTANRTCNSCATGTFSTTQNAASCGAWTTCDAGTSQTTAGTSAADRVCSDCNIGTYCAGGSATPIACATGTWDADYDPATVCESWTTCQAGEYILAPGSTTADRTCDSCATGTFSTTQNAETCESWTNCQAGDYVLAAGSTTANRTCNSCVTGTYSTTQNAASCDAWTNCQASEYVLTTGSGTHDRTCNSCATGTFTATQNAANCGVWTTCVAGTYQTADGTSSQDRTCTQCEAGTYCAGANAPLITCGLGDWDDDGDPATECVAWTDCVDDEYVTSQPSAIADRECEACASGAISSGPNATACTVPEPSCRAILLADPSSPSGAYTIDPDGAGQLAPFGVYCDMTTDGGGWTLVRRQQASATGWNMPNDNLAGAVQFGVPAQVEITSSSWGIRFNNIPFNQFLFRTGDRAKWGIVDKSAVYSGWQAGYSQVTILKSHLSNSPYVVSWYKRPSQPEDPWVSVRNHNWNGILYNNDNDEHSMLYGEEVAGAWTYWIRNRNGSNVWIR